MSLPSKITWPPSQSYRRKIVLPSVVLPQPDSPTIPIVFPFSTENDTSSTAFKYLEGVPNRFLSKFVAGLGYRKGVKNRIKSDKYIKQYNKQNKQILGGNTNG